MADSGTGKSRFGGRVLCFLDFLRGAPQVILDCAGSTIQNFLDKLISLPSEDQEQLWPRIRYTELGATDYVTPLPFFYRLRPDEPLAVTAGRYLEVIRRTDPYLATASVEGWNALYEMGIAAGILAASLDGQIMDVIDLIQSPKAWLKRHEQALPNHYGVKPALAQLKFFSELTPDRQRRLAGTLLSKLMPYRVQPELTAFVAGKRPGVTMDQVQNEHLTWLIDGRKLPAAQKQELLLWVFRYVTDYIAHRGIAGRERPLHFFIDEITSILGFSSLQNEALAEDLEQLISVHARNFGCVLTIAHQSLIQINSERIRSALMAMPNQIIGRISSPDDRLYLAQKFLQYDPHKIRKTTPVYFNMGEPQLMYAAGAAHFVTYPDPRPIDYTTDEFTIPEQVQLFADRFSILDRFDYLLRLATAEGSVSAELYEGTIEDVDPGCFPDPERIDEVRRERRKHDGDPVAQVLIEIDPPQQEAVTGLAPPPDEQKGRPDQNKTKRKKSKNGHDTIKKTGDPAHESTDLPVPGNGATGTGTTGTPEPGTGAPRQRKFWGKAPRRRIDRAGPGHGA